MLADRPAPSLEPSRVTEYDLSGNRLRDWAIDGQNVAEGHGLTGIALDSAGRLYIADANPARVVRLDPASGAQSTYRTIPDFDESAQSRFGNRKPLPNGAAFGPDGSLYVTDTTQGVIWRVPPGGGAAQKWFSDPRLVSFIGPNGIRLMADQRTLLFVVSNSHPPGGPRGPPGEDLQAADRHRRWPGRALDVLDRRDERGPGLAGHRPVGERVRRRGGRRRAHRLRGAVADAAARSRAAPRRPSA